MTPYAAERMKELTDKLRQGVRDVFNSDQYAAYLNTVSKFHSYSFRNVLLILMQRPDASRVAGYTTWKKLGRTVKKGEKGIAILAPCPYTRLVEKTACDANGDEVKTAEPVRQQAYKLAYVFDISQTEGRELPSLGVDELTGDVAAYDAIFNAVTDIAPVPVNFRSGDNAAKGCYNLIEKCIYVNEGMSQVQTVKTVIHETAHSMLHDLKVVDGKLAEKPEKGRNVIEVEAESVAYIVCQHFGIDTSDYSFGYVTSWSRSRELDELTASLECISATAAKIIDGIESRCPALCPPEPEPAAQKPKKRARAHAQAV